jgi:tripartite-type tricarboxylate transporter receptor subunit TctC
LRTTALLGIAALASASVAAQEAFPTKPIHLIVPFVAGGTSDILARIIGQGLTEELGQPVIVENKPGAGGNIGSDYVAKAPADGYTLILASVGTHAINSSLYAKMPYDPVKDFTPVALFATVPTVLVVNPKIPVDSVRDLITLARKRPGELNFASAGVGTTQQLAGEMLRERAGVNVVHVPYKGGAQAVTDLLGGQVTFMFPNIPVAYAHIKAGKLKALAVASNKRSPALPDVPTMAEAAGLEGFDVSTWFGVLGPAGMPASATNTLNRAITKQVMKAEIRSKFELQGAEPLTSTPDQFGAYIRDEVGKWARVVKTAGIKLE